MADRPGRLPTSAWVLLAVVAGAAAAGGGVLAGSASDDDRDETTVERASSTTAPAAGDAAPPTTTTATSTTAPPTADGLLPEGFYVVLASESDDDAGRARLAERAEDIEGAQVTSTSLYESLPRGDARIGQAPDFLPAGGVSVVVVGPMSLEEAQGRCAGEFGGECSVRQLRAG